jgi:hypothetical protein
LRRDIAATEDPWRRLLRKLCKAAWSDNVGVVAVGRSKRPVVNSGIVVVVVLVAVVVVAGGGA